MWSSRCAHLLVALMALAAAEAAVTGDELADYIENERQNVNPRYRPLYHVAGPVGWINDPNGFSFYDGYYHLFYQYHPFSSEWGPMHWGHARSADLAIWEELPVALRPDEPFDIDGCFSGSAVGDNGVLALFYTGHILDETSPIGFRQVQNLATSTDGIVFTKDPTNPVIELPPDGNLDFRDPKVWKHENHWYMVIGNPNLEYNGRVIFYRSEDMRSWEYLGSLAEADRSVGYMWECPDFFELNGKFVLLISPQGMEPVGDRYHNHHQTGYIVGDFDYETLQFVPTDDGFIELDYGFDFYAAQTTDGPNGRRVLVGWLGMWEEYFEEAVDGWAGLLTIPRDLTLNQNNRLIMTPVPELSTLREANPLQVLLAAGERVQLGVSTEVEVSAAPPAGGGELALVLELGEGREARLVWRPSEGVLELQRDERVRRAPNAPALSLQCRFFLDASSLEIFCGDVVFTCRIYPRAAVQLLARGGNADITVHVLRSGLHTDSAAVVPMGLKLAFLVINIIALKLFI